MPDNSQASDSNGQGPHMEAQVEIALLKARLETLEPSGQASPSRAPHIEPLHSDHVAAGRVMDSATSISPTSPELSWVAFGITRTRIHTHTTRARRAMGQEKVIQYQSPRGSAG